MRNEERVRRLTAERKLSREDLAALLSTYDAEDRETLARTAREISQGVFGHEVYTRGLIEISNHCKNNCLYCGIRRGNAEITRYRLTPKQILDCCAAGYELGFRTFVMQGGEDAWFTDERMAELIGCIRAAYPDCAITLSIGEKSRETYQRFFDAGANRYLLRHETADEAHYHRLHPPELSFRNRMRCLRDLRDIGFQTGCGCMVGSPYQTAENLADDILFMADFRPQMIGIGPFIPHHQTPFAAFPAGSAETTLLMLSILRILLPKVLLPATTALGTVRGGGREQGVLAGANVVMPNLSPLNVRKDYLLYDNKLGTNDPAGESLTRLRAGMEKIGYHLASVRGDYPDGKDGT